MKIEIFDSRQYVVNAVVSTNPHGMISVLINLNGREIFCSYQGASLNLAHNDDTDGAIPKHACFHVSPECSEAEHPNDETEVVVIAETPAEDILLTGFLYESRCKDQHEFIFVPRSMLDWKQISP